MAHPYEVIPPFDVELVAGPNDGERLVVDLPEPPPELSVPRRLPVADEHGPADFGVSYRLRLVAGEPYANPDGVYLYDFTRR